jgi:hypothetical protein
LTGILIAGASGRHMKPSTALSQEADVGVKWNVHRGEQGRRAVSLIVVRQVPARPFFSGSPGCVRSSA